MNDSRLGQKMLGASLSARMYESIKNKKNKKDKTGQDNKEVCSKKGHRSQLRVPHVQIWNKLNTETNK